MPIDDDDDDVVCHVKMDGWLDGPLSFCAGAKIEGRQLGYLQMCQFMNNFEGYTHTAWHSVCYSKDFAATASGCHASTVLSSKLDFDHSDTKNEKANCETWQKITH